MALVVLLLSVLGFVLGSRLAEKAPLAAIEAEGIRLEEEARLAAIEAAAAELEAEL